MFFKEVINQEEIRKSLISRSNSGRISHALLFSGPEGTGKLATALAFAQYVNCLQPGPDDSCGQCSSCVKNVKFSHPDLHFVFPVNTSKEVKKDASSDIYLPAWREQLTESPYFSLNTWYEKIGIENKQGIINTSEAEAVLRKLSLVAYEGKFKIMLIWQADKMNTEAANKLLKILEEPPERTLFFLTANSAEDLLPTIVSRTQNIHFSPLSDSEISASLREELELDPMVSDNFARLASGSYTAARETASGAGDENDYTELFINWMRACWSPPATDLVKWVEDIASRGREKQKAFLSYSLHIVRESLNIHFGETTLRRMTQEEEQFMVKFHSYVNGMNGIAFMKEFNETIYHIERNANPKIVFLDLSIKVRRLLRAKA